MGGNQKIHCTVGTCIYNDDDKNVCLLEAIKVAPVPSCDTEKPDESMCSSYEYGEK